MIILTWNVLNTTLVEANVCVGWNAELRDDLFQRRMLCDTCFAPTASCVMHALCTPGTRAELEALQQSPTRETPYFKFDTKQSYRISIENIYLS